MEALDAINIEQSVLGSFIVDDSIRGYIDELKVDMFTVQYNQDIFKIMKDLQKNHQSMDIQTLAIKIKENKYAITTSYLSNLVAMSESYAIDTHINILRDKYLRRFIIKNCTELFQKLGEGQDINLAVYNFESKLNLILGQGSEGESDSIVEICERLHEFLLDNNSTNMKFGIKYLDDMIGGLFEGELTTIGARSGVGKTALALQIMLNCIEQGRKVLFVSREMSNIQIFMRNIAKKTGVSVKNMKTKNLDEESWRQVIQAMCHFSKDNLIYINDKIKTVSDLKRRIRQIKPDLVIVDYLQLMSCESNERSREREVASLSREMRNISLDFNIPVIQLSQLNDETKDNRPWQERPMRDSKAIFHDSNNVIYIHEPTLSEFDEAVETIKKDRRSILAAKKKGIKLVDFVVAKSRDDAIGYRHHCYNGPRLHFEHIDY